jgi:ABC-type maltose transport system permease subunit
MDKHENLKAGCGFAIAAVIIAIPVLALIGFVQDFVRGAGSVGSAIVIFLGVTFLVLSRGK